MSRTDALGGRDHAIVFAGGDRCGPGDVVGLPQGGPVIAADSGAEHTLALGWDVDVLVGDLDSIEPALVDRLRAQGAIIERHPAAKDQTDLALALDMARDGGARAITVVGGHGGRLDHLLANVLLLASADYASVDVDARMGAATVTIVRSERTVQGVPGELVSLLAMGGEARGVTTTGLLFALHDATLSCGSSWGVSNEMLASSATVSLRSGVVALVQPGVVGSLLSAAGGDGAVGRR